MAAPGEHDQALRGDQARQLPLGERLPAQRLQVVEQDDPPRGQGATDEGCHPTAQGVAPQAGEIGTGAGQHSLTAPRGPHLRGCRGEEGRGYARLTGGEIERGDLHTVQAHLHGHQHLLRGTLSHCRRR